MAILIRSGHCKVRNASQLPKISHVLELILYGADVECAATPAVEADSSHLPRSVEFYRSTLRLGEPFLSNERIAGFSLGNGTTLLLFQRGSTTQDLPMRGAAAAGPRDDAAAPGSHSPPAVIPAHGLSREEDHVKLKTHFALAVDRPEDVDAWERELGDRGVPLLGKVQWPGGGRSVYFSDPDAHVGELASRGIWPHY
ncbi:hypothetical protein JCM3774_000734 [Rhodotorula dairenensis]